MRTTLNVDDDVFASAKELAATQGKSIGEVISGLAREAMRRTTSLQPTRNGIPLLSVRPGSACATPALVRALQDELP